MAQPPQIAPQQIVLLATIGVSVAGVLAYLRWRGRLPSIRPLLVPACLFLAFGTLDAGVTLRATIDAPWREGNPFIRSFLLWKGWVGQCLVTALWIAGWSLIVDSLGLLSTRLAGRWAGVASAARLWILYALAVGHLDGLLSWTRAIPWLTDLFAAFDRCLFSVVPWLKRISPFGAPLYTGLAFGGLCALLHCTVVVARRGRFGDPFRHANPSRIKPAPTRTPPNTEPAPPQEIHTRRRGRFGDQLRHTNPSRIKPAPTQPIPSPHRGAPPCHTTPTDTADGPSA